MGTIGEIKLIEKWLRLHYTLNPGIAFGISMEMKYLKLFLTSFRIFVIYLITVYLNKLLKNSKNFNLSIFGWLFILGGAIGNLIDSIFYGIFLKNALITAPMKLFYGQVIDMILI